MARNDIEVALRDGSSAADDERPDFEYRVRLVTSHLVEPLDSLNAYSQENDVKALIACVPADAQKELSKARSALRKVGHFPSPEGGGERANTGADERSAIPQGKGKSDRVSLFAPPAREPQLGEALIRGARWSPHASWMTRRMDGYLPGVDVTSMWVSRRLRACSPAAPVTREAEARSIAR